MTGSFLLVRLPLMLPVLSFAVYSVHTNRFRVPYRHTGAWTANLSVHGSTAAYLYTPEEPCHCPVYVWHCTPRWRARAAFADVLYAGQWQQAGLV